jgi:hypothetical protein
MLQKHLIPVLVPINTRFAVGIMMQLYLLVRFNNGMEEPHIHNPATVDGGSISPRLQLPVLIMFLML